MMYDLSNAEARILKEYLDGKNARDVAQSLFVSESTVRFHVRNILLKTHSNSMLEATVKTLKMLSLTII
ncbi:LuxR C-terminal-related transcriptional regulator [Vibrio alfacsensis]|uniref:LuxR C-terminal-related transcriptional regulator n=1 Tax=Vibrio alfacsensis TaxID=1074311 RepID=UPI001C7FA566